MPQYNTGNQDWDQGLSALSGMLYPDPSKVAQAGLYGAQQRNERLKGDITQYQYGARQEFAAAIPHFGGSLQQHPGMPPAAGQWPPLGSSGELTGGGGLPITARAPAPGGAQPSVSGVSPGTTAFLAQIFGPGGDVNPHGVGMTGTPPSMASPSPGAPPSPTATDISNTPPRNDPLAAAIHPATFNTTGGGTPQASPAAADGSPAEINIDWGHLYELGVRAGIQAPELSAIMISIANDAIEHKVISQNTYEQVLASYGSETMLNAQTNITTQGMASGAQIAAVNAGYKPFFNKNPDGTTDFSHITMRTVVDGARGGYEPTEGRVKTPGPYRAQEAYDELNAERGAVAAFYQTPRGSTFKGYSSEPAALPPDKESAVIALAHKLQEADPVLRNDPGSLLTVFMPQALNQMVGTNDLPTVEAVTEMRRKHADWRGLGNLLTGQANPHVKNVNGVPSFMITPMPQDAGQADRTMWTIPRMLNGGGGGAAVPAGTQAPAPAPAAAPAVGTQGIVGGLHRAGGVFDVVTDAMRATPAQGGLSGAYDALVNSIFSRPPAGPAAPGAPAGPAAPAPAATPVPQGGIPVQGAAENEIILPQRPTDPVLIVHNSVARPMTTLELQTHAPEIQAMQQRAAAGQR